MLLQRVLTALVLAIMAGAAVFFLPATFFSLFIAIIALLGAWEWTHLIGMERQSRRLLFLLWMVLPMMGIHFWTQFLELLGESLEWPEVKEYSGAIEWLVIAPVLFWILMMMLIRQVSEQLLAMQFNPKLKSVAGWLVLFSAWMFLSKLRAYYGVDMVMYFLLLIWTADIVAYFSGKKWGKDPLSPAISPNKTVQGMYGALVSAAVCAVGLRIYYGFSAFQAEHAEITVLISIDILVLSVLTVLVSIYGDLFFSLVKRQKGVKDSGSILPGHGGVLDRIDSIVAAAPFFYAGISLIGRSIFS